MQTRHRIPSIFNLSMVDVLCCALGCVLLLWLLNMREARDRAAEASETDQHLSATRQELAAARKDLEASRDELTSLLQAAADLSTELDRARRRLQASEDKAGATAALLDKTQADRDAARATSADLEKKLAATGRQAADLAGWLGSTEARLKEMQATADLVPGLREEIKSFRDKAAAEQAMAQALDKTIKQRMQELAEMGKELADLRAVRRTLETGLAARDRDLDQASKRLADLQGEKRTLLSEVDRARAAAENRFAGINLTGRRVVFLVDTSGSMGLLDQSTPAPDKWPGVREAVVKVLRSLPDLEKFQVITFAEDASYLLGQEGRWLDFDPKTSPERVRQALAAVKPRGGTNLYAAVDAAFRLRAAGMDTVYLVSDGLPDRGVGLPAGGQNLSVVERADVLSKHIRRTLQTDWNREQAGRPRVRINCVGFFYESPDVGAFLWALARENDGSFVGMSKP